MTGVFGGIRDAIKKVRSTVESVRNRVFAVKRGVDARVSAVKERANGFLDAVFPPEYRRATYAVCWFTGKFVYEFASILAEYVKRFLNFLGRVSTYWQTVFLTREYGELFVKHSLRSIFFALVFSAPELLLFIALLIVIPFFFAMLCSVAAQSVIEFIYLLFKYMPPVVWVPVVAVPLAFVAFRAYVRTNAAWKIKNETLSRSASVNRATGKGGFAVTR